MWSGDGLNCARFRLVFEPVAETAHIPQVARLRGIRLDLLPEIRDVVVDDAGGGKGTGPPGGVHQLVAAQHPPARPDEHAEELELDGRHVDGFASAFERLAAATPDGL